jgi:hypothetical protein
MLSVMADRDDKLRRAFARLQAIQRNVPGPPNRVVEYGLIEEYHGALGHLRDLGYDVAEFMIPQGQIERSEVSGTLYVRREVFLTKVDTALGYFEMEQQEPKPTIGFRGSSQP